MRFFDEIQDGGHFEELVAALFRARKWHITYKPAVGPDRGRDLVCVKTVDTDLSQHEIKILVQCKLHNGKTLKHVAEKDVGCIYDLAASYGVQSYMIATSTKLTSNLQDLLARLTLETSTQFRSLIGGEIEEQVRRNDEIFKQFFPLNYTLHLRSLEAVTETGITKVFAEIFGRDPTERELQTIIRIKYSYPISRIVDYRSVWTNDTARRVLDRLYQKLLKRSVDPIGHLEYGYAYLTGLANWTQIEHRIKQSKEYLQRKPKIRIDVQTYPDITVQFDRYGRQVLDWWTYHTGDFAGMLEIKTDNAGTRMAQISPVVHGSSFRVAFPIARLQLKKDKLKVRFKTAHYFEFFVLVRGQDERLYYLTFVPKKRGPVLYNADRIGDHTPYGFSYVGGEFFDGRWHTLKRNLNYLLRSRFKTSLASVEYFCFHVKGPFLLDYIELS